MNLELTNHPASNGDAANCYYMGLDSGGTNTRAMLANIAGDICGVGFADSANPNHYPREKVCDNLQKAIRSALAETGKNARISSLFMGASGVSTLSDKDEMRSILRSLPEIEQTTKIRVENDTRIGLTGGLAGRPGIVLISGTGSACYGANDAGEQWLCGGWGAIADDIGSAPWIGTRALRAVVQAEDGRMPPTLLRKMVFDYLELQEPRQLIHRLHNEGLDRAEIGRLAPLVVEAFRQGDDAASKIIHDAAKGLSELLKATVDRLFGSSPCEMILVGGLALSGPPFQPLLMENIHNLTPNVTVRKPELAPVQGAVLEAMREAGIAWTDQILASLKLADLSQLQNKK